MTKVEKRVRLPLELKLRLRDYVAGHNTTTDDVIEDILYDYNRGDIVAPRTPESTDVVLVVHADPLDWQTTIDNARQEGTSVDRIVKTGIERLIGK